MSFVTTSTWIKIKKQLVEDRHDLVEQLIQSNIEKEADKLRGKIQQIDDILEGYPARLTQTESDT